MLFCSQLFLVFFLAVFVLYWALPWPTVRIWLLLVASYYFYASWNQWLALLIFATTLMDYGVALGMNATARLGLRRALLVVSLIVNLGMLCYFKYANFFLQSLQEALTAVGATASLPMLQTILPIGISFYTFEAINYTVDVYRGRIKAERNLSHFLLFILFFPHLVAGPIVRAADFLPQIRRPKRWSWVRLQVGAQYFLLGLFKKLAIADRMAMFADPVFKDPDAFGSYPTWVAVIAYALQIYCDFSGYTDMAIGAAHMLGYRLARNFDMPYLSANIAEFWRRWHISLSSWLRDYLFIPLGGSRGARWQTYRNLLVTMTLGGLWHGASWTFVAWGVLHGVLLIGHRAFQDLCGRWPRVEVALATLPGRALCMALTFLTVALGWVFFRATTFGAAATILGHLFVPLKLGRCPMHDAGLWYTVALVVVAHVVGSRGLWLRLRERVPAPALGAGYAAMLTLALVLAPDEGRAFIYFQF
jgi:alginate O-acetyltransferase complex protein AlgI